ncbi:MAG: AAA family ATPase [Rhodobacteraceae bacterium]|nr:AAA family ATPase [Paracoccaceae bacterium]
MILEEIRMRDFRCFYGETSIRFSKKPDRNVTIVHAENGVGKTTLLNAMLWCFFGETTKKFEKRRDILNYDAKKAGRDEASVEVFFEHNEKRYRAARSSSSSNKFMVWRIEEGSQVPLDTPDTFINTVLPRKMAAHFLFDGEHAEVFLGENNEASIKSAVRDILGCSLIERAIEDLNSAKTYFQKQIPAEAKTIQTEELNNHINILSDNILTHKKQIDEFKKRRRQTEQQINDIEAKLRGTAAAKEIQKNRDRLNKELDRIQRRKRGEEDEVYKWLGENGRFIVSKRITEETFSFLDKQQHQGRIPSPYNEEFVKDILEAEQCICGTKLAPGSSESRKVESLLTKAANRIMRDRITKVRAQLTVLRKEREKAPGRLREAKQKLAETNSEYSRIEAQLNEASDNLKGIKLDNIYEQENRRDELMNEMRVLDNDIGAYEEKINSDEKNKEEAERKIQNLANLNSQAAILGHRLDRCKQIIKNLRVRLEHEEYVARYLLHAEVCRVLEATSRKVLHLKMSEDYVITLRNTDGTVLPKSSGENQLLGLAFTSALIQFAKSRKDDKSQDFLPGTIAPLVLDSPFGQLDEAYRTTTAEFIPKMAQQVVLFVSKSQGSKSVLETIGDRLGAEYLLVRHNSEPQGKRKQESRSFAGKEYKTAIFSSEYDGTEIVEITSP